MIDHAARLRAAKVLLDTEQCAAIGLAGTAGVCGDAAADIERLQKHNDALEACVNARVEELMPDLRAEIERLREALRKIADHDYTDEDAALTSDQPRMIWELVAKAALSPQEHGPAT